MKAELISSPAIVQAVYDYQKQRADLNAALIRSAENQYSGRNDAIRDLSAAIANIVARIERLCLHVAYEHSE